MKAKVTVAFTDKNDLTKVYSVGDTFDADETRIAELEASGHVKPEKKTRKNEEV